MFNIYSRLKLAMQWQKHKDFYTFPSLQIIEALKFDLKYCNLSPKTCTWSDA